MYANLRWPVLALGVMAASLAAAQSVDKSGVKPNVISLPSGAGSIEGLGDSFEPQLNTGTSVYAVNFSTPQGVAGHQPKIGISYNSGSGNGPLGIGWSLNIPKIMRQTDKGIPKYTAANVAPAVEDTFLFDGEELVPLSDGTYRCENEVQFTRFRKVSATPGGAVLAWEGTMRDGKKYLFGLSQGQRVTRSEGNPNSFADTYCWCLSSFTDTNGNTITYDYASFADSPGVLYPAAIEYAKTGDHSHRISFLYTGETGYPEQRTDVFSDFRPGFEIRTARLLREVAVFTDNNLVRRYVLDYTPDPDLTTQGPGDLALGFSLLHKETQLDRSNGNANYLPPLTFAYTPFHTGGSSGKALANLGFEKLLPSDPPDFESITGGTNFLRFGTSLIEVIDINADGLADFISSGADMWQAYLNQGEGNFSDEVPFASNAADGKRLDEPDITLADLDGDGVTDLFQKTADGSLFLRHRNLNGFGRETRLDPSEVIEWGPEEEFTDETGSAEFGQLSISHPTLRMLDLDFDKRTDVIRPFSLGGGSGGVEYLYNRASGWVSDLAFVGSDPRLPPDWDPEEARFDEANESRRADLADLNGDRLQDWYVASFTGDDFHLEYWPNKNGGAWASKRGMEILQLSGVGVDDLRVMDVNADGLSDLVLIEHFKLTYWINLGADQWSDPIVREDAPNFIKGTTVIRQMDVNGNGATDLVWDNSTIPPQNLPQGITPYMYFDFVGDVKPNMLQVIDNGIGRRVLIEYKSSTDDYLKALEEGHPWTTKLPFPVQVVSRINTNIGLDLEGEGSPDRYITDITYRDGFYDTFEKEFRGFAYAQKIQRGDDFDIETGETGPGTGVVSGPSLVARHRFLTGSPDQMDNDDYPPGYLGPKATDEGSGTGLIGATPETEKGGREEESLKGKPVFVETLDPAILNGPEAEANFNACARASALAGQGNPFSPAAQRCSPDKYVYTRVHTDWKVRRLYRPVGVLNPRGRFADGDDAAPTNTLVAKSISFPFTETTDTEVIEANGILHDLLNDNPVEYPNRSPRRTRSVAGFDDYGNQILDANYGIIGATEPPNLSVSDDERIKKTTFALAGQALNRWIISRPSMERVEDENGIFVSEKRHYYDGTEMAGLPLGQVGTRGLEKRSEAIVTENPSMLPPIDAYNRDQMDRPGDPRLPNGATIQEKRNAHDIFGNTIAVLDPLGDPSEISLQPSTTNPLSAIPNAGNHGHLRILDYDNQRHVYPVRERIVVGDGQADLVITVDYDHGFGVITSATDFNGNRTDYRYDSFARLVSIIKPYDSAQFPTQVFRYQPADPHRRRVYTYDLDGNLTLIVPEPQLELANAVFTSLREKHGLSDTFDAVGFTSGNGQKLMTLEEDEQPGQWVVKEATRYNRRGEAAAVYQPYTFASSDPTYHLAGSVGIQHDGNPVTQTYRKETRRDATGREIQSINPPEIFGGSRTHVLIQNLPFEKHTFDEEDSSIGGRYAGTPMVHYQDGLGRLIGVDELVRLGDDGMGSVDLMVWPTRYDYDLSDKLVHILDSQNNEKWMRYDGIGRRIFMNDPDRGVLFYTFDDASNVRETVDAKGQRITYTFDGVNRLLTEDYHDEGQPFSANRSYDPEFPIGGSNLPDVAYHYDAPIADLDLGNNSRDTATNTKGFLSYLVDLTGEEHTSYDQRGRVLWTVKRIADPDHGKLVSYKTELTYDALDRVVDLIYPDEDRVRHEYNSRNLLERISGGSVSNLNGTPYILTGIDYIPSGQLKECRYGNGVITDYGYDPRLRMDQLTTARASESQNPLLDYRYTFDGASNITRIDDRRPASVHPEGDSLRNTQIFGYDDLYRITGVQYSFALPDQPDRDDGRINYRYDRIGNMLAQTSDIDHVEDGLSITHHGAMTYGGPAGRMGRVGRTTPDPGPHALTATESGRIYPYDANGNMTDIDGLVCTWDFKDRLVGVENDKIRARYRYDYTDRRIAKLVWDKQATAVVPATTTLYIDKFFEVREHHQPVKYVWAGETRVAQIVGTLEPSALRVQRFSLAHGWNLLSMAVDAPNTLEQIGLGTDSSIRSILRWDPAQRQFSPLNPEDSLPGGSVFWLYSDQEGPLVVVGTYTEPESTSLQPPGDFVSSTGLVATDLSTVLSSDGARPWLYVSHESDWTTWLPDILGFMENPRLFLPPGNGAYIQASAGTILEAPPDGVQVQYYHQDHLGSSNMMANGKREAMEESVCYPFGSSRKRMNSASESAQEYLFTQKELDQESSLQYFEARYLTALSGRFTSVDTLARAIPEEWLSDPQRGGIYVYGVNRPIILVDPTGMDVGDPDSTRNGGTGGYGQEAAPTAQGAVPTAREPAMANDNQGITRECAEIMVRGKVDFAVYEVGKIVEVSGGRISGYGGAKVCTDKSITDLKGGVRLEVGPAGKACLGGVCGEGKFRGYGQLDSKSGGELGLVGSFGVSINEVKGEHSVSNGLMESSANVKDMICYSAGDGKTFLTQIGNVKITGDFCIAPIGKERVPAAER